MRFVFRAPVHKQDRFEPTDVPIDDTEWLYVHRAADSRVARVEEDVLRALRQLNQDVNVEQVRAILAGAVTKEQAIQQVVEAVASGVLTAELGAIMGTLREVIRDTSLTAAIRTTRQLGVGLSFNIDNPYAVRYAEQQGARLITRVTDETRQAVRRIVSRAIDQGGHPYEQARRIREVVGLTEQHALAVDSYRQGLLEEGFNPLYVDRMASGYRERLLTYRARNVARTETLNAANAGLQASWEDLANRGILDPTRTRRVWITTPDDRRCIYCAAMDGQEVGLTEPFHSDQFGEVMFPTLHPSCRCTVGLIFNA